MNPFVAYLLRRIGEASTLRGAVLFVCGLAGLDVSIDQADTIVAGALALAGVIGMALPDRLKPPRNR